VKRSNIRPRWKWLPENLPYWHHPGFPHRLEYSLHHGDNKVSSSFTTGNGAMDTLKEELCKQLYLDGVDMNSTTDRSNIESLNYKTSMETECSNACSMECRAYCVQQMLTQCLEHFSRAAYFASRVEESQPPDKVAQIFLEDYYAWSCGKTVGEWMYWARASQHRPQQVRPLGHLQASDFLEARRQLARRAEEGDYITRCETSS